MKRKKILNWMSQIITSLVFVILLTMLFMVLAMRASGGEPSLFGYQVKSVMSGSMEPDIETGSIIVVEETESDHHFEKNDVITFKTEDDMIVTHRINQVENNGQSYITKGDANDAPDVEAVPKKSIIGMYSGFTVPYFGYIMSFATSREGAALLLVLPGVSLIVYSIFQIGRALRAIDRPKSNMR